LAGPCRDHRRKTSAQLIQPQVDVLLRERRASSYERQMPGSDGDVRWIDVHLLPHLSDERRGRAPSC
jgi:hypothetical protein